MNRVHHDQRSRRCEGCKRDPEGSRTEIVAIDRGHPGLHVVRFHVDHVVLLKIVGRRRDQALGGAEVHHIGLLAAVVVSEQLHVIALAVNRKVAGIGNSVQDGSRILGDRKGSRPAYFTEYLITQVEVFHGHDGSRGLPLALKFIFDLFRDLSPGLAGDMDLAEDREVDVTVLVHGVAGSIVRAATSRRSDRVRNLRQIEQCREFLRLAVDKDGNLVLRLDGDFLRCRNPGAVHVVRVLEIGNLLRCGTATEQQDQSRCQNKCLFHFAVYCYYH